MKTSLSLLLGALLAGALLPALAPVWRHVGEVLRGLP